MLRSITSSGRTLCLMAISFTIFLASNVWAQQDVAVFEVRKTLALNNNETIYKDYFINGGTEAGLRPGIVVTVRRRNSVYDSYTNRTFDDLKVPVGRLKVIHSQNGLAVARLHSLYSRENLPILEHDFIMVGDRLDLSTAKMERKKTARVKKPTKSASRLAASAKKETDAPKVAADYASKLPMPEAQEEIKEPLQGPVLQ